MKNLQSWAISAYADGELENGERAEVERMINESPEAQAELMAIRRQKQALHQAFGSAVDEPIPAAMLRAASMRPAAQRRSLPAWAALAASLALVSLGAGGGWLAAQRSLQTGGGFEQAALSAHEVYSPEVKHPVEVTGADSAHLQQWLSKRIGVAFEVPDLSDQGYQLLGGRLLAEAKQPAALLMYEDASKRRLSVYLASNPQRSSSDFAMKQEGKFVVCTWTETDMVYAFVGEQSEAEMKHLASIAHDRFES